MPAKLQWVSHPAREEPGRNWIIVVFLVFIALAMWLTTASWYWVGFGVAVVLLATRQWFLPTFFTLDEDGVEARYWLYRRHKTWTEIKRAIPDAHGVLLSPFALPNRLDPFRGLFLRFSRNREQVMTFIRQHVPEDRP